MKARLLTLFVLLSITFAGKAQYVTIPDTAFVTWLNLNGYSTCLNGNQMDTTCSTVINGTAMQINAKGISDLEGIQYFDSLNVLIANDNYLTHINALPPLLTYLDVGHNRLDSMPILPPLLYQLNCTYNNLITLPTLPNGLLSLDAYANRLTSLPTLPLKMRELFLGSNYLTLLPPFPDSLQTLDISSNDVTIITSLPPYLKSLTISNNSITTLAPLPAGLRTLHAFNNFNNTFPSIPASVTDLDCSVNHLTTLPTLPTGLEGLACSNNLLGSLPTLPTNLTYLYCSFNNLTLLPSLPHRLRTLWCHNNNLTNLPAIPPLLMELYCSYNQLTTLPALNDSMLSVDTDNNPNLTCLPSLRVVRRLAFYNTAINCLPNYPRVTNQSNPALSTVPLCTPFNANGCAVYSNLSGMLFIDTIQDCTYTNGEIKQHNIKTSLYNNGVLQEQTLTGSEGLYSFDAGYGNYEIRIDTTNTPFTIVCPGGISKFDTLSATDSTMQNLNFALRCKGGFDLAAHSISSPMRFIPGRYTYVNIQAGDLANFFNGNCAYGVSGVVTAIIDGPARYISPLGTSLAPSSVNGDTVKWNIADFAAIDGATDFYIVVETDTYATAGSTVCLTLNITPHADNDSSNNVITTCYTVVSSFDPNDKQVSPPGDIDTLQKWLTYTVRFQNTGTAEAQHIYIMDTLDANVDGSTFQLLAYSHQPQVLINENIVRFNFANINLPDSNTNEPESHGYIQYKVKLKNNLPVGTTISNTAFIYFDFNAPVVTNTTTSTIAVKQDTVTVGVASVSSPVQFSMYPNPTQQQVTITTTQPNQTLQIFDIEGRIVFTQNIIGTATTIHISNMASGVYVVGLSNTNLRKRLIKL